MKKIVLIIAVLILTVVLAGCGGSSGGQASSTETAGSPATESTATVTAKPPKLGVPRKFKIQKNTPKFFVEALKKKEPILISFYNDDDTISKEVLAEIKIVYDKYNGSVNFFNLKSDLNEQVTNLAEQFQIGFIPYIAVINRQGEIIFEKTGYVDNKVIEQAVYDAVNK